MKKIIVAVLLLMATIGYAYQAAIVVPNGTGAQVRANMNNAIMAVATLNAGVSAPATYANLLWLDTATTLLKLRNNANTAWISIGTVNDGALTYQAPDSALLGGQNGAYYRNAGNLNAGTIPLAQIPATLTGKDADTVDGKHASATPGGSIIPVGDANGRIAWGAKPAFRGALVIDGYIVSGSTVTWSTGQYNTDTIFSGGSPSRLTVPSGVTKVKVSTLMTSISTAVDSFEIRKNGSGSNYAGKPSFSVTASGDTWAVITSPVIPVTAGDYFEVWTGNGGGPTTAIGTWFSMEVVE